MIIATSDVERWAPSLPEADIWDVTDEANAVIRQHAPCVLEETASMDVLARARGIMRRVIKEAVAAEDGAGLESETIGPFGYKLRSRGGPGLLTHADKAELRALCASAPASAGGPLGSFPAPVDHEGLFYERRVPRAR